MIIENNKVNRRKIVEMTKELMPEYQVVKARKSGIIVLKKNKFSFKKEFISMTDLVLVTLPERLAKRIEEKHLGHNCAEQLKTEMYILLKLTNYEPADLIGTLWNHFIKFCKEPKITFDHKDQTKRLELKTNNSYIPVLSYASYRYIPSFKDVLEKEIKKESLIERWYGMLHNKQLEERIPLREINYADVYQII